MFAVRAVRSTYEDTVVGLNQNGREIPDVDISKARAIAKINENSATRASLSAGYILVDERNIASFCGDVRQFLDLIGIPDFSVQSERFGIGTYESASTSPNDDQKLAEIRRAVRKRVACIVDNCRVGARREYGKRLGDRQRQRVEVRDRIMLYAVDSRILQRNYSVVKRRHGNCVDGISRA